MLLLNSYKSNPTREQMISPPAKRRKTKSNPSANSTSLLTSWLALADVFIYSFLADFDIPNEHLENLVSANLYLLS
ncbi:hypothetical protein EB796_012286 [Bugula neritina]|uniref:Uncharacterized protein n=1 Tax=Bugula neritina TaxID=10212 RepID=A0A7J7JTS5_BUGNE|nr:hypothetical protein EB796_012286 [Bugula neritina]